MKNPSRSATCHIWKTQVNARLALTYPNQAGWNPNLPTPKRYPNLYQSAVLNRILVTLDLKRHIHFTSATPTRLNVCRRRCKHTHRVAAAAVADNTHYTICNDVIVFMTSCRRRWITSLWTRVHGVDAHVHHYKLRRRRDSISRQLDCTST